MHLQLQENSVLIGKQPVGFTEHYYTEWDDGLGKERITLFMVLSIASTQVPGAELGKEAFQLLQDHFLNDLSGDPYERFEFSLREINQMVNKKEKELGLNFIPNMNVISGVIQGDHLFISQRGEAQAYLVRKRHVSSISEGLCDEKNHKDLFQNIASGQLEVGDAVILTTSQLVQYVTPNDLSKIFSEQAVADASAELKDLLHGELDHQLALLGFEILEKFETVGEPEAALELEEEIAPVDVQADKKKENTRIKDALKGFREWLKHENRFAFAASLPKFTLLARFKGLPKRQQQFIIGGVLGFLILGILLLSLTTGQKKQIENAQDKLDTAENNLTQAATRGAFNKNEAAQLLDEAERLTIEVLDSGLLGGQASALLDEVEEQRNYIDNVILADDEVLTKLVDLNEVLSGETVRGLIPYEDKHVIFTEDSAIEVVLDEASSPILLDDSASVVAASFFPDRNNVIFITNEGVLEYTDGNAQIADTSDVEWNSGIEVDTYSSRIYLLDPENSQIWRYQRGSVGFGGAQAYVDPDNVDLSEAVSMAIDGVVWILDESGEVTQLLSGEPVSFSLREAPLVDFDGATKIKTSLESLQLHILDPERQRILIFDKSSINNDLIYNSQYDLSGVDGELVDFYVDQNLNKLIVLTTEALYELAF